MTLKELREKRVSTINTIRSVYAREQQADYQWRAEDTAEVEKLEADLKTIEERIERSERDGSLNSRLSTLRSTPADGQRRIGREDFDHRGAEGSEADDSLPTYRDRALALQAWFRGGSDLTNEQEAACQRMSFNPSRREINLRLENDGFLSDIANLYRDTDARTAQREISRMSRERLSAEREGRTMSALTGATGGYAVPIAFLNRFEENLLAYSGMMQVAEVFTTEGGAELPIPTVDDTSNEGEIVGESASVDGSTDPELGQVSMFAYKFSSKMLKMPYELLEDNAFNLAARAGGWLGQRLGRAMERKFTLGTGAGQPKGITNCSTLGVTAASGSSITIDECFDLEAALDDAYSMNARYMCNKNITLHLRKKKDSNNRYLWEPNVKAGEPDTINGRPVTYNTFMQSSVATATKTLLFGDFSKYLIRRAGVLRLKRLDERYADKDQVAFIAFQRADGNLLDAGTAPVLHLLQG